MKSSGISSVLGIGLEKGRLTGVFMQRSNGGVRIEKSFELGWSLEGLMKDTDRFGGELRKALDAEGIRERHCVVCIPLEWAYTTRVQIPALPEADVDRFLRVQAEREFPIPPEETVLSVSRWRSSSGTEWATLIGIPANRIAALGRALHVANLRPLSMTFAIAALIRKGGSDPSGSLLLLAGEGGVDLAVVRGGAVLALRSLEEGAGSEREAGSMDTLGIARQIRITLGQFTGELQEPIGGIEVYGLPEKTNPLLLELRNSFAASGMKVELASSTKRIEGLENAPAGFEAVAKRLLGQPAEFEFLRIPPGRFKQILEKVSSKSNLWLGGVAAAFVLLLGGGFLVQQIQLSRLQSEWADIEAKVDELTVLQDKIRRFKPWFDDSIPSLTVARILTEAFPEEGSVWLKSMEIKDRSEATCSGQARGNREWMAMVDRLRNTPGVLDLQILQVRGAAPLQFTLSFRWDASYRNES
jgi:hypothetical protein